MEPALALTPQEASFYPLLSTVHRYIFIEWLKSFCLTLGVMLGLLILNDMYANFGDMIDFSVTPGQAVAYYTALLPGFLPVILPISLLLSLLFSLSNLHRNNELIVMRAIGFSIGWITLPLWLAGGAITAALFFLNAKVVPWSVEQTRVIWDNMEFAHTAGQQRDELAGAAMNIAFNNRRDGRLWVMNRFNPHTYRGFGVAVHDLDDERRERSRVMAREVHYDDFRRQWVFIEGRALTFDPESGDLLRSVAFDRRVEGYSETPRLLLLFRKRPRDLSLNELRDALAVVDPASRHAAALTVRYHGIWVGALSGLIIVGLAIPFATTGVRVNPMVGVSKSIGLFALYYVLDSAVRILGEREIVAPAVAAWLPALAMGGLAIVLMWRTK